MSPCYVEKRIKISNSNLIQHRKNYTEKWQTTDINVRKLNIAINLFLDFFIVLHNYSHNYSKINEFFWENSNQDVTSKKGHDEVVFFPSLHFVSLLSLLLR